MIGHPVSLGRGSDFVGDPLSERSRQDCNSLQEWYSARTTFIKATADSKLAQLKYTGQPMHEYMKEWELCSAQLASMDVLIDEGLLMATFIQSFGDRTRSSYGAVLAALGRTYPGSNYLIVCCRSMVHMHLQDLLMIPTRIRPFS